VLSERSKLSLCQFLALLPRDVLHILFQKHGLPPDGIKSDMFGFFPGLLDLLPERIGAASPEQLHELISEVIRTQSDLRSWVSPEERYDQRFFDMVHCFRLDGYGLDSRGLIPVDPTIEGTANIEDDLSAEVRQSGLPEGDEVLGRLDSSAGAFRQTPPDFNACLSNARVALQTLATAISRARRPEHPGTFDETSWGQVLAYLRSSGLITTEEEAGLAGVFRFVSPGAHRPLGPDETEMARLGRSLVASMCYFLVKRFNS